MIRNVTRQTKEGLKMSGNHQRQPEQVIETIRTAYAGRLFASLEPHEQDALGLCSQYEALQRQIDPLKYEIRVLEKFIDRFFSVLTRRDY